MPRTIVALLCSGAKLGAGAGSPRPRASGSPPAPHHTGVGVTAAPRAAPSCAAPRHALGAGRRAGKAGQGEPGRRRLGPPDKGRSGGPPPSGSTAFPLP